MQVDLLDRRLCEHFLKDGRVIHGSRRFVEPPVPKHQHGSMDSLRRSGASWLIAKGTQEGKGVPIELLRLRRYLQLLAFLFYLVVSREPIAPIPYYHYDPLGFIDSPRSAMLYTPAALELALLCPFTAPLSSGGDDDKPEIAESTLVRGSTVSVDMVAEGWGIQAQTLLFE